MRTGANTQLPRELHAPPAPAPHCSSPLQPDRSRFRIGQGPRWASSEPSRHIEKEIWCGFIPVLLAYSLRGFKCLCSLTLRSEHTGPQGDSASGDLFSCRLPSCQLGLLLQLCEPPTPRRPTQCHRRLCLCLCFLLFSPPTCAPNRQSPALISLMEE